MKFKISGCFAAMTLLAVLAIALRLFAQEQQEPNRTHKPTITEFNALHAGRGAGQGTVPQDNNATLSVGFERSLPRARSTHSRRRPR